MRRAFCLVLVGGLALGVACGKDGSSDAETTPAPSPTTPTQPSLGTIVHSFDLANGAQGWESGFFWYKPGEEKNLTLIADYRTLPAPLDESVSALYIGASGGGLGMYFRRQVSGLVPGALYSTAFSLEIATSYSRHCLMTGDAPGWTHICAGAFSVAPERVVDSAGHYALNVPLPGTSASQGGSVEIGDLFNGHEPGTTIADACHYFVLKTMSSELDAFRVRADDTGSVWLLVAAGKAGSLPLVEFYVTRIAAGFTAVE